MLCSLEEKLPYSWPIHAVWAMLLGNAALPYFDVSFSFIVKYCGVNSGCVVEPWKCSQSHPHTSKKWVCAYIAELTWLKMGLKWVLQNEGDQG